MVLVIWFEWQSSAVVVIPRIANILSLGLSICMRLLSLDREHEPTDKR